MVEVAGIEPASLRVKDQASTCVDRLYCRLARFNGQTHARPALYVLIFPLRAPGKPACLVPMMKRQTPFTTGLSLFY